MSGRPVTINCKVTITPGASGPPDTGTILGILPPVITANGRPLATSGSICLMVNSLSGVPYPLVIGPTGSSGVRVAGRALVRMGDQILTPSGMLSILGPPAPGSFIDSWPP